MQAQGTDKYKDRIFFTPIKLIDEGDNTRKTYSKESIAELTASIREVGVRQPVLLRPKGQRFELVFGYRRKRAAEAAGLENLPSLVEDLTDEQVLELQVIENAQREGVPPLEEADAYHRLHVEHRKTVDEIAARVGKSRTHVYQRLKLATLGTVARGFLLADKMSVAVANLVARIPDAKLQAQAAKEVSENRYDGSPMPYAQAVEHVQRNFMLRLESAPFDTTAEALVPNCGACTDCPKRTGNQRELFADVKSADVCTDPPCYQKKAGAAWKLTADAARDRGIAVLDDTESQKKLYPYPGSPDMLAHGSGYVDLKAKCMADPKGRTYSALLGRAPDGHVLARDAVGGVHKLFPEKAIKKALKDAGHDFWKKEASAAADPDYKAERAKAREERDREDAIAATVAREVVAKLEKHEPSPGQWRQLLAMLLDVSGVDVGSILERRGVERDAAVSDETLTTIAEKMTGAQLRALFLEVAVVDAVCASYSRTGTEQIAKAFGIDLKAARKRVIAERAEAAKAKPIADEEPKAKKRGGPAKK